ncbi:Uncharacterised protein [Sebaldella termitidis]|jgi:CRISPR/Cas system CSM-associated protein Csm5 (group 7 of RAMP superfamily)|uniref:Uncharacterized protein n=1 Tax=Sebaldella termitidis (strain ATCC 33386 / NCTC 11300) TaxID=526218 RepID=D1ANE0_SEBTE|nr:hypothetical protein [Sebaldella termitidis]ACZ09744.1 hypothetical protein Sterm_2900 [Sebaldella termitidis ATCC 33386]SUI25075.1 Uncharacterised protein [Sebaldella termitidis]
MDKIKILLGIGILSLVIGGFLTFSSKNRSQDNLDIAMNATNAQEAAEMISKNNRSEVGQNTLGMALLGFGAGITAVSVIRLLKNKK